MAALRDLTPSGLRRLSMDERKRLLKALLSVNYTWLSEREREHLFWGHGLRCRMDRADFERAAAKVAKERRIRLALAVVMTTGAPPGAVRRATWERVNLAACQWDIPRLHLPNVERQGMQPNQRFKPCRLPTQAVDVFCRAREVGDGWGVLGRVVKIPPPNTLDRSDVRRPPPRRRPPTTGLVFPGPDAQPLPEHALGRRLRVIVDRINEAV